VSAFPDMVSNATPVTPWRHPCCGRRGALTVGGVVPKLGVLGVYKYHWLQPGIDRAVDSAISASLASETSRCDRFSVSLLFSNGKQWVCFYHISVGHAVGKCTNLDWIQILNSQGIVRSFVLCGQGSSLHIAVQCGGPGRGRELVGVCGVC